MVYDVVLSYMARMHIAVDSAWPYIEANELRPRDGGQRIEANAFIMMAMMVCVVVA